MTSKQLMKHTLVILVVTILAIALPVLADVFIQRKVGTVNVDAARTQFNLHAVNFTAATAEALISLTPQRDYVNGTAGTTHTVTGGKRMRLIGVTTCTKNAGAASQGVITRVRVNPSGAVVATSPVVAVCGAGTFLAVANVVGCTHCQIDAGDHNNVELSGANQVGITQQGTATAGNDVILYGIEY